MKGIILAGGLGSRLKPLTAITCKQLLPVYDKPLIFYPLSVLMLANLRDILVISGPEDLPKFEKFMGNGNQWGINLSYKIQHKPEGIAQAFLIAEEFIGNDSCCLILGDNLFFGHGLPDVLAKLIGLKNGAAILGYRVKDPQRYGVVCLDKRGQPAKIIEKPEEPVSDIAVTGLYFYDNQVVEVAKCLKPSLRNELEITEINQFYLKRNKLQLEMLGRGFAWLDTGTFDSLLAASNFVQTIEQRQGLKIACLEEIAYKKGWISRDELLFAAEKKRNSDYGSYLFSLVKD